VIQFKDDARTNSQVPALALDLSFTDANGKTVDLKSYRGKKHVVLVFLRSNLGVVCPLCSTQTSRLINNYPEIARRDGEVLLVYPDAQREDVTKFLKKANSGSASAAPLFPVLLDENLTAVDKFGLRGDPSKPATYIISKKGQVAFAYVGATANDRPSVQAILAQLDALSHDTQ